MNTYFFSILMAVQLGASLPTSQELIPLRTETELRQIASLYPALEQPKKRTALLFLNGVADPISLAQLELPLDQIATLLVADGGTRLYFALDSFYQREQGISLPPPDALVGDLDSISQEEYQLLSSRFPSCQVHRFPSAKDFTDFEAALELIDWNKIDRVYVVGALGGRIDHALSNLCVLLRPHHSQRLFFIDGPLAFSSYSSPAMQGKKKLITQGATLQCELSDGQKAYVPLEVEAASNSPLFLGHGPKPAFSYTFGERGELLRDLALVGYCLDHPGEQQIQTPHERLFAIDQSHPAQLQLKIGQTLSLLPIRGPVRGINSSGLQWELRDGELSYDFVGISNLVNNEQVSISVREGSLLCVVLEK